MAGNYRRTQKQLRFMSSSDNLAYLVNYIYEEWCCKMATAKICMNCKHFKVANIYGPVELWVCLLAENGTDSYRNETDTCDKWEAKDDEEK